jgi:hypothetical protein
MTGFECQFCLKEFKQESRFLNHICPQKAKHSLLQTIQGQAAYGWYCEWLRAYKRKEPSIETFADSRYFKSFIEFEEFLRKHQVPNPSFYVQLMSEKDISPMLWIRNECFHIYLDFLDKNATPIDHVNNSIMTLYQIQDAKEIVSLELTLYSISVSELIHLIRLRKMSPWLLLCSKKFGNYVTNLQETDRDELMKVIIPEYWADKLQKNKESVNDIKEIVHELEL